MNINIVVDDKCGYNCKRKAEQIERYIKENKIHLKKLVLVISNDFEYVISTALEFKSCLVINITENLSEYHICKVLNYVTDLCYMDSNIDILINKIIRIYNKHKMTERIRS